MRTRITLGVVLAVAVATLVALLVSSAATPSCVTVADTRSATFVGSAHRAVANGTLIGVGEVEPEEYMSRSYPSAFPYQTPRVEPSGVLNQVPSCNATQASPLPVSQTFYRAAHAGTATITVALAPAWQHMRSRLRPRTTVVTVTD